MTRRLATWRFAPLAGVPLAAGLPLRAWLAPRDDGAIAAARSASADGRAGDLSDGAGSEGIRDRARRASASDLESRAATGSKVGL